VFDDGACKMNLQYYSLSTNLVRSSDRWCLLISEMEIRPKIQKCIIKEKSFDI
jgi:hypothetical protein